MRIETIGTVASTKANSLIKEVVTEVLEKANLPKGTKYKIRDLSCMVVFMVDGEEKALTVNHGGLDELFTVKTALDKKGKIDRTVNNSKASFLDDYTRSVMKGEEMDYSQIKTIASEYDDNELELLSTLEVDGKAEKVYRHIEKDIYVLRYYLNDMLVGELETNTIPSEHIQ